MGNAGGHIAILAGAGVAAYFIATGLDYSRRGDMALSSDGPVVVNLPKRSAEPSRPSAEQQRPTPVSPADRDGLARQLQSELGRVGCYDGEVNGVWTTSTRLAMKAFTDRVNAKLPIDKPDQILLSLVQGQRQKVCGAACPAGPALTADGRCQPDATLARAGKAAGAPEVEAAVKPNAAIAAPPIVAAAPALVSPPTEVRRAPAKAEQGPEIARANPAPAPPSSQPQTPTLLAPPVERPHRTMQHSGPVPPAGIYEQRRLRRQVRRSRQIRYVRSLIRSLQRAAAGMPLP